MKNKNRIIKTRLFIKAILSVLLVCLLLPASSFASFERLELLKNLGYIAGDFGNEHLVDGIYMYEGKGYFLTIAEDPHLINYLWQTDGTQNGTVRVRSLPFDNEWHFVILQTEATEKSLATVNNNFFLAGDGLWISDGTSSGTKKINETTGISRAPYVTMNSVLYWKPTSSSPLWKSDGTSEGTGPIAHSGEGDMCDLFAGMPSPRKSLVTVYKNKLYYRGSSLQHGCELWSSDGTPQGTGMVVDINPYPPSTPADPHSEASTDEIYNGGSFPGAMIVYKDELYFAAYDNLRGRELWKTDGTAQGTQAVADILPGKIGSLRDIVFYIYNGGARAPIGILNIYDAGQSSPYYFSIYNNELYFMADDGSHGYELWKSDGTTGGTRLLLDAIPGPSDSWFAVFMKTINDKLFFGLNSSLWWTDGTTNGTINLTRSKGLVPDDWANISNVFFFVAHAEGAAHNHKSGYEIWKTDGTEDGTTLAKKIMPYCYGEPDPVIGYMDLEPTGFLAFNDNTLLFRAYSATCVDIGIEGDHLYEYDTPYLGIFKITSRTTPVIPPLIKLLLN